MDKIYACIDLKSFYASVECMERKLNPLTTNLVVADNSRTEKTVCLAVSPSLKQYGISGRARLYQVIEKVNEINYKRKKNNKFKKFKGKSYNDIDLKNNKELELDFIIAPPRMAYYIKYSTMIYNTYLKFISKDDIFVYSIDEVFCDLTSYLKYYKLTPEELVTKMIKEVYLKTGITATGGIGTNLYLAKVAMDVVAKHVPANEFGVRIASLNERTYREKMWPHTPITDIWRVGPGIAKRLEKYSMYTMGDICKCSLKNEDLLYKLFGVNAEILIDHAWGIEPCTIEMIKKYKPITNSLSSGQVLHNPYDYDKAKIVLKEMIDNLSLDLINKHLVTKKLVLNIMYDVCNMENESFTGETIIDQYKRIVPKPAHGTINLEYNTNTSKILTEKICELYERIVNKNLLIRKLNINVCNIIDEKNIENEIRYEQIDLFSNNKNIDRKKERKEENKEKNIEKAIINIKNKYGKNSILKGMDLMEGATAIDRNKQIGGHHE